MDNPRSPMIILVAETRKYTYTIENNNTQHTDWNKVRNRDDVPTVVNLVHNDMLDICANMIVSLFLSSSTHGRFYLLSSDFLDKAVVVTGVVPSPPPVHASIFIAHTYIGFSILWGVGRYDEAVRWVDFTANNNSYF